MAKTPEPQAEGRCRKSQDGDHLWDLRREKDIRVYVYGFWQCLLCRVDTMTIEPKPGSPNGGRTK